jgi:flavorubredoxin
MIKQLTPKVDWVGKVDWELKSFHGDEYSIEKGSSYNSYLIRDKKTVLIDTVWQPFDSEFIQSLKNHIDLKSIDYIIMNHSEIDHSGALPELMREIPQTPIYCTANGVKIIKGHYHTDWNFVPVKTGDTLNIGESTLTFIEAPMLHWPDTMFTYMSGENILFSNDAFGQHYATESLYNNTVNKSDLNEEALKYYANIIAPFSSMVTRKINEIIKLNLPIDMICPSHGVIWKENPMEIVNTYLKWANNYAENQITIIYDTMWNSTRKMAEAIADGIRSKDSSVTVKIYNTAKDDKNDIATEVFRSHTVLVGSSTINNGYLYSISGMLEMLKGFKLKGKKAAAFGSYGWSGESVAKITEELKSAGFTIINDGLRTLWMPDQKALDSCVEYGKTII